MPVVTPREPLTRERVLAAAVAVADEQGIDALTLRRLAEALRVHPTSIYNHLPSKEAILDGVAEQLVNEAALPTSFTTWPDWVRAFAAAMRGLAQRHPGAFAVFTRRPAQGAGAEEHLEAALEAFAQDGFSTGEANAAVAGTALTVMGLALNEAPRPAPAPTPGLAHFQPDRYPRIAAAVAAVPETTDGIWELIVEALIVGLRESRR